MPLISGIRISAMKDAHSTAEAAKLIGISKSSLLRWLADGTIPEPKRVKVGGIEWRIWSKADIARARKLKATMRPGPKRIAFKPAR